MGSRKRWSSVGGAAAVVMALALVATGCGGGKKKSASTPSTSGKTFPQLKVVWGTTDYMDPGLSYRLESWQLFQDVYIGLVVKAHEACPGACTKILPGLAESMPTSNADGTEYKFTLRKGLKYSNGE